MKIKYEVKKTDGSLAFVADIECLEDASEGEKLGLAVQWGYKNDKDLRNGDYTGVVFDNLSFINASFYNSTFCNSSFINASFYNSRFDNSTFCNSTFYNSRFDNSSFDNSSFDNSSFYNSSFNNASFNNASFDSSSFDNSRFINASFDNSSFYNSRFDEHTLRPFKHDLWGVLLQFKEEIPSLVRHIEQGKINGSIYSGECACLMGTIANIRNEDIDSDKFSMKDESSHIEQWFRMIRESDTPDNSFGARKALDWIKEFLKLSNIEEA